MDMKKLYPASFLFQRTVLVSLLLALYSFSGFAQNCAATLTVEKNRNAKSADEEGALFTLTLTNTSTAVQEYSLSTKFLESSCANSNRATKAPNVRLQVGYQAAASRQQLTAPVRLQPGQSYVFVANVQVPSGTPYNTWSCIEVQAASKNCRETSATSLLKVYVPDPSEG
jgi:hypothetical protein